MRPLALTSLLLLAGPHAVGAPLKPGAAVGSVRAHVRQWKQALPKRSQDSVALKTQRAEALSNLVGAARSQEPGVKGAAVDAILDASSKEPDRALRMYSVATLQNRKSQLNKAQQARLASERESVFPDRPNVPARGPIVVRHYVGAEFFRGEVSTYRKAGFTVVDGRNRAVATQGRLHVTIFNSDKNIFQDMDNTHVHAVIFSGHSDVGGVVEKALPTAPVQRGNKMLVLMQCKGTQTMPMVAARYTRAQMITTKSSSFEGDDANLIQSLYRGLEQNQSYAQIRSSARQTGDVSNYLFPDNLASAHHWDLDKDGRLDTGAGRLSDKRFDVVDGRSRAPGQKMLSAVGYLNSTNFYYQEDTPHALLSHRQVGESRFVSGGLTDDADANRVTKIEPRRQDGRTVFKVSLNSSYAHEPKEFVEAAAIYEMENHLTHALLGSKTAPQQQSLALLASEDYLYRMVPFLQPANRAMERLSVMHGLPKLSYSDLEPILLLDKENLGTRAQLKALDQLIASRTASEAKTTRTARPAL